MQTNLTIIDDDPFAMPLPCYDSDARRIRDMEAQLKAIGAAAQLAVSEALTVLTNADDRDAVQRAFDVAFRERLSTVPVAAATTVPVAAATTGDEPVAYRTVQKAA